MVEGHAGVILNVRKIKYQVLVDLYGAHRSRPKKIGTVEIPLENRERTKTSRGMTTFLVRPDSRLLGVPKSKESPDRRWLLA